MAEVVVEELETRFSQRIAAGRHVLTADEPLASGGRDQGPSPFELLLSALGSCKSMTMRSYADRKQWPLERVVVKLRHRKEDAIDLFEVEIALSGALSAEQRARLLEIADRCPVHRTLVGEKRIVTRTAEEA